MLSSILLAGALATSLASAWPFSLTTRQAFSTNPNAPCGLQAFGYGPPSTTDTNFQQNPVYQFSSLIAPAPSGYNAAFRNATGSSQQAGYMGYYLLQSYNTTACAGYCNNNGGCTAFNIYYERDPLQNPAAACPNPLPTTNIKCSIYSQAVSQATANNNGQYREQFHVVIAGSDGFNKN